MNLDFHHLLPENFSLESRVWIYQGSRVLTLSEALELEMHLNQFATNWISHGADVKAYANLFFGQFIVLMADETQTGVSGCSTDSSVRFVKQMGEKFKIDFFDRSMLAFFIKDKVQLLPMAQFGYAAGNGSINADTLYFNNLIANKDQLLHSWIIPVKQSWLSKKYPFPQTA